MVHVIYERDDGTFEYAQNELKVDIIRPVDKKELVMSKIVRYSKNIGP